MSLALPPPKHWYFKDLNLLYVDYISTSTLGKILIHTIFLFPILFIPMLCSSAIIKPWPVTFVKELSNVCTFFNVT